jgi:hypothetical protein
MLDDIVLLILYKIGQHLYRLLMMFAEQIHLGDLPVRFRELREMD